MVRWENDRGGGTYRSERRDDVRHEKVSGAHGLEQVEMKQEEKELDAAGSLYVALTEYKKQDPATPSHLSVGTPENKRSDPVESRFRDVLERRRAEAENGELRNCCKN